MKKFDENYNNRVGPELYEKKSRNIGIKLFKLSVVILSIVAGMQAGIQYLTSQLGLPSQFYPFWKYIDYSDYYGQYYPQIAEESMYVALGVGLIGLIILVIQAAVQDSQLKGEKYLYGSAHWASIKDIKNAGLLFDKAPKGPICYVGAIREKGKLRYLVHGGPEHILCFAPTRSGKGVGLVVPTMLSWSDSIVCNDIKGELWALTSGWRQKYGKNKVIRLEFASEVSAHWNPLEEIRVGTEYEVGDAQNLALLIVDPDGKGLDGADGHWKKTAFAFYTGIIIYVLRLKKKGEIKEANLKTIDSMLSDPDNPVDQLYKQMKAFKESETVANAGADMLDRPEEERGSVLSTVKSNLSLFRDPIVAKNVNDCDFHVKDLMNYDNPVTVYLISQPSDKGRIRPILRIFICMCMRLLADKMEFHKGRAVKTYKHRLLMMLDEFPALGKMDIVQESLAFVAGYGIKCYLITQDLGQLYTAYGKDESVTSNCHIQNCFPAIKDDTCDYISRMTGDTTIVRETKSRSGSGLKASISKSVQETQRRLLTPGEVKSLPGSIKDSKGMILEAGKMLIFAAGYPPIFGEQPLYFKDPLFSARSQVETAKETDRIYSNNGYQSLQQKTVNLVRETKFEAKNENQNS